jgi:prohibitin 2
MMVPSKIASKRKREWDNTLLFGVIIATILVAILWSRLVVTVPSGHVGALWHRFGGGTVKDFTYGEGTKIIFPWDRIFLYDARLQRVDDTVAALTSDGLRVLLRVSATFYINRERVGELHAYFGGHYQTTLISPTIASQVDLLAATRPANQMYSLARADMVSEMVRGISQKVSEAVRDAPGGKPPVIKFVELNIHDIELPASVQSAIEDKLNAQESTRREQYLVERERYENERRQVQAEGTRNVQRIITPGLTAPYLRWQATDALTRLALTPSTKTIVVGPGVGLGAVMVDGNNASTTNPGLPQKEK